MTEEQASIFSQEEKLDSMQKYLVSLEKKYDQTIERYGTGVRPSWVSAELAFIGIDINACRNRNNKKFNRTKLRRISR